MQALRVGVICTHPFSRGDVCPPLLAVPVQLGMEARDASWPGVVGTPPPGDVHHPPPPHCPLAFQGDDSAPTLSFPPWAADPLPAPTPCGLYCPKRSAYLSPGSPRPPKALPSPGGDPWCQGVAWAEQRGLCGPQPEISGTLDISKPILGDQHGVPAFDFVM